MSKLSNTHTQTHRRTITTANGYLLNEYKYNKFAQITHPEEVKS